ncbi:glycosyltransferase family 9 protein [Parafrankia sp. FMc2]|uniref:glycosyltransferase family 9 protein n=1 Tax=Parafrankia sp. FMc2 TaxID=3233196 RepID=UPI003B58785C
MVTTAVRPEIGAVIKIGPMATAPPDRLVDLTGRLGPSGLVGLLAAADVMIGNDSGLRHLAGAVGTPTVGVFWCGDVINAGPLDRGRHRVIASFRTTCPRCGAPQEPRRDRPSPTGAPCIRGPACRGGPTQ